MTRDNEMVYVGVDYHRDPLQVAVKSADGRPLANRRCANDVSSVVALVSRHGRVSKVAVEACCGSMSFAEELAERTGWTVELAHPGVTRRMRLNPDKSDLTDADVLAELGRANWIPRVWLPPKRVRECRALLNHRESLVRQRTACKLQVRAVLRQERVQEPEARAWTIAWLEWLQGKAPLSEDMRWLVLAKLAHLRALALQIALAERRLREKAPESPLVTWLLKQPGIGLVTAWWIATAVGRFDRFRRGKQLSRFCGLSPRNASSGKREADAGLIPSCSRDLRAKLLQAAHRLRRHERRWRELFTALTRRGKAPNVAVVAVANRWMRWLFHQAKELGLAV